MGEEFVLKTELNVLVAITGSISVLNMPNYLGILKHKYKNVKVIMSESAERMLPSSTISLFCDEVFIDDKKSEYPNNKGHVELARWADIFLVIPATANTLGQVANGLASNFLLSTILAHAHPVVFYPNMNKLMWETPSVQRNIKLLKEDGHIVVIPEQKLSFEVASGTIKKNYVLPEIEKITNDIQKELLKR